ncbi:MAG: YggS family pyridoxal phosphate-dependent enzyme [Rhodospirillales bacterium]|nr:YggS family pyridoxal phosphate-dependent enzyme [Rhodospirillales bacterium]
MGIVILTGAAMNSHPSSSSPSSSVVKNLQTVQAEMAAACAQAGRKNDAVTLVAVSKTHDAEQVRPALLAGQRVFGENRVQEAEGKWPALRAEFPDVKLHLIGPLQTNKIKPALKTFDVIESVDREKLARALAKEMAAENRHLPVFIQVNTGLEPQKAGIAPQDVAAFVTLCKGELGLEVLGLMCIPPVDEEPALHFALLAKLAAENGLKFLSMGMSSDFATAIALGATHVRVGTAIFGSRPPVDSN